jgi:hypothetical protein
MLSERTPCKGIDRNKKMFLFGSCRDICQRICGSGVLVKSLPVVRKQFVPRALACPFNVLAKVFWPKFMGKLKSITTIFSHNLLYLFELQQFTQTLTGQ